MTRTQNSQPMSIPWRLSFGGPAMMLLAVALTCAGCGKNSVSLTSAEKQAFEQGTPEVKQAWQRALAADKANDYTNTIALLDNLAEMQLSEAQKQALYKEREAFNQRLWQAAEKNDPAAVKAVQGQTAQRDRRAAPPPPPAAPQ